MNNVLLTIAGILIVVLAALFAVPYVVDWNAYRGVFEEEASRILGREVRVGGNVALRLLPTPYVSVEKLRVADSTSDTGRPFFRTEAFTMWLSVPPLLKGILEAREVELTKPELELAVDASGHGNWSSLRITPGTLPFAPESVALQSVKLVGGTLGVTGPGGSELFRVTAIDGQLSADDLEGPYRFKGTIDWSGGRREVRVATAQRDPNGDVRFKAIVGVSATGNHYTVDGTLSALDESPTLKGTLSAKVRTGSLALFGATKLDAPAPAAVSPATLPADALPADATEAKSPVPAPAPPTEVASPQAASGEGASPPPEPAAPARTADGTIEITAGLDGTGTSLKLSDVTIAVDRGGIPQLISGTASAEWSEELRLDVELASKWIDLDRLTGSADEVRQPPLDRARAMFDRLIGSLPATADTRVALSLDQVGLGGEAVSGLRFHARRSGGALELEDVRANLPGGSQIALDGNLDDEAGNRRFRGSLSLAGHSLMRFATWGFGETPFAEARSDGPFSVAGQLVLGDRSIELTEATAELNGTPLVGALSVGLSEPRRVAVTLEGHRIDLDALWPGNPGLAGLRGLIFSGVVTPGAGASPKGGLLSNLSEIALDIKAGELIDGATRLARAEVEVSLSQGRLSIPRLTFHGDGGLEVDLSGGAIDVPEKPHGALRGVIDAPTASAVQSLAQLADIGEDAQPLVDRVASVAPWRAGANFSFGERTADAVDVALDGILEGERMIVTARFDGGRGGWRDAPADITASLMTRDVDRLLERIAGVTATPEKAAGGARQGKLFVKAAGKPSAGLVAVARLDAERLSLDFNGRVSVPEGAGFEAKGDIRVDADDARSVLALTGLGLAGGAAGAPVKGTIAAARNGAIWTFASPALKVGQSQLSGVMTLAATADGPPRLDADIVADGAELPSLLSGLVRRVEAPVGEANVEPQPAKAAQKPQSPVAQEAEEALAAAPGNERIWPDAPFDFSLLEAVTGNVKASIRVLSLEPGLAIKDARIEATLTRDRLSVDRLEGAVLGGKALSRFSLSPLAAGAALDGTLEIAISSKGSAEGHGGDEIEGDVAALKLSFGGKALTPDSLIGSLSGKGELKLGDVALSGVSPAAVSEVSEAALLGRGPGSGQELVDALRQELKSRELRIGKVAVPVSIEDGALKLARVGIETPEGSATFATVVELQTLAIDSEWKIVGRSKARAAPSVAGADATKGAPPPQPLERRKLPPVSVVFVGKLKDLGAMEARIAANELERELTVRRMERDVDELERLRRTDELRARQEAERQKERERQAEIERQKALEAAEPQPQGAPLPPSDGSAAPSPPGTTVGPNSSAASPAPGADPASGADAPPPAEASAEAERPRRQPRRAPANKNTWQPFQITPYQY